VALRSAWCFAALCAVLACGDSSPTPGDSPPSEPTQALPTQAASAAATETSEGRATTQPELDPQTGLVVDPRAPLVAATCTGCHSAKLVTQNRGTRKDWDERLRWMQKNHNLWDLETGVRETILDYLSEHYAPEEPGGRLRRAPLPAHLRPPTAAELAAASQRTGS
jgi:hypothetical protein